MEFQVMALLITLIMASNYYTWLFPTFFSYVASKVIIVRNWTQDNSKKLNKQLEFEIQLYK